MQAAYIPGLPRRMGLALAALFAREGYAKHKAKLSHVCELQNERELLPLDAGDGAIYQAGDSSARECSRLCDLLKTSDAILDGIRQVCQRRGVPEPLGETPAEQIARAVDRAWWVRSIRKAHARRFEHSAIRLGFTSLRTGPYLSNESATRQARRNQQNAKLLESIELQNELGHTYTLAELAALGTANKAIRRGELMTRIRGFEEIAQDLRHVGVFATLTCPSKYHGVLSGSGETNPKYTAFGCPTPRQAQAYLVDVWARTRAALHRAGIRAYGFRIAEPHHDGCPHWHMLMFVPADQKERYETIVKKYALLEDGDETGAQENRVKFVGIDPGKGSAAGYIAKYVAKNIDGENVGDHKTLDGYRVVPDLIGNLEITPSQRVTYWAQTWGIRQFQQIGGAPVGVWRELRRIKAETVAQAPEAIRAAWTAAQKDGDKQASYADYVRAYGGVHMGRFGAVLLAKSVAHIDGKYAAYEIDKPVGVYAAIDENRVYESVRYTWTQVEQRKAVAVALPWTRVNNCTQPGNNAPWTNPEIKPVRSDKEKIFSANVVAEWKKEREGEWNAGKNT